MHPKKKLDYDFLYKIILVGDASVGKTSFLIRYTKQTIPKTVEPTVGIEYASKSYLLKDGVGIVKAQIWDTYYEYSHYRKSVGALLFYDLTNEKSFQNVHEWLQEIQNNSDKGIQIMLIGNKFDLVEADPSQRKVSEDLIQQYCEENNLLYHETSAKSGTNVKESFEDLIEKIYQSQKTEVDEEEAPSENQDALRLKSEIHRERLVQDEESKTQEEKNNQEEKKLNQSPPEQRQCCKV